MRGLPNAFDARAEPAWTYPQNTGLDRQGKTMRDLLTYLVTIALVAAVTVAGAALVMA